MPTPRDPLPNTPVPERKERRVDTTQSHPAPDADSQHPDGPEPRLPHERDQSVEMTGGEPSEEMQQAYKDVQRGLQDTDRGKPAHEAYQKQKR